MRRTRLLILPGARCLTQMCCILLYLSCPIIGALGREQPDLSRDDLYIKSIREIYGKNSLFTEENEICCVSKSRINCGHIGHLNDNSLILSNHTLHNKNTVNYDFGNTCLIGNEAVSNPITNEIQISTINSELITYTDRKTKQAVTKHRQIYRKSLENRVRLNRSVGTNRETEYAVNYRSIQRTPDRLDRVLSVRNSAAPAERTDNRFIQRSTELHERQRVNKDINVHNNRINAGFIESFKERSHEFKRVRLNRYVNNRQDTSSRDSNQQRIMPNRIIDSTRSSDKTARRDTVTRVSRSVSGHEITREMPLSQRDILFNKLDRMNIARSLVDSRRDLTKRYTRENRVNDPTRELSVNQRDLRYRLGRTESFTSAFISNQRGIDRSMDSKRINNNRESKKDVSLDRMDFNEFQLVNNFENRIRDLSQRNGMSVQVKLNEVRTKGIIKMTRDNSRRLNRSNLNRRLDRTEISRSDKINRAPMSHISERRDSLERISRSSRSGSYTRDTNRETLNRRDRRTDQFAISNTNKINDITRERVLVGSERRDSINRNTRLNRIIDNARDLAREDALNRNNRRTDRFMISNSNRFNDIIRESVLVDSERRDSVVRNRRLNRINEDASTRETVLNRRDRRSEQSTIINSNRINKSVFNRRDSVNHNIRLKRDNDNVHVSRNEMIITRADRQIELSGNPLYRRINDLTPSRISSDFERKDSVERNTRLHRTTANVRNDLNREIVLNRSNRRTESKIRVRLSVNAERRNSVERHTRLNRINDDARDSTLRLSRTDHQIDQPRMSDGVERKNSVEQNTRLHRLTDDVRDSTRTLIILNQSNRRMDQFKIRNTNKINNEIRVRLLVSSEHRDSVERNTRLNRISDDARDSTRKIILTLTERRTDRQIDQSAISRYNRINSRTPSRMSGGFEREDSAERKTRLYRTSGDVHESTPEMTLNRSERRTDQSRVRKSNRINDVIHARISVRSERRVFERNTRLKRINDDVRESTRELINIRSNKIENSRLRLDTDNKRVGNDGVTKYAEDIRVNRMERLGIIRSTRNNDLRRVNSFGRISFNRDTVEYMRSMRITRNLPESTHESLPSYRREPNDNEHPETRMDYYRDKSNQLVSVVQITTANKFNGFHRERTREATVNRRIVSRRTELFAPTVSNRNSNSIHYRAQERTRAHTVENRFRQQRNVLLERSRVNKISKIFTATRKDDTNRLNERRFYQTMQYRVQDKDYYDETAKKPLESTDTLVREVEISSSDFDSHSTRKINTNMNFVNSLEDSKLSALPLKDSFTNQSNWQYIATVIEDTISSIWKLKDEAKTVFVGGAAFLLMSSSVK